LTTAHDCRIFSAPMYLRIKRLPHKPISVWLVLIFAAALGCTTAAQTQGELVKRNVQEATQRLRPCFEAIETNPTYKGLADRIPIGSGPSTLMQLGNTGLATKDEVELIVKRHNDLLPCREKYITEMMNILPGLIPTIVETYHKADLVWVDLMQANINWGEGNKRRAVVIDEFRFKIQAAANALVQQLAASHNAELVQRQAALSSLSQWADRQTALLQNQQLINTLNRPRVTTCTAFGRTVQCFSR
jgi:hypothetical protein